MIAIGSASPDVCKRWWRGLGSRHELVETTTFAALYAALSRAGCESALVHLSLPNLFGVQGLLSLRNASPCTPIVVFSDCPSVHQGRVMLAAGASGYCNANVSSAVLASGIALVALGEFWVDGTVVNGLIKGTAQVAPATDAAPPQTRLPLVGKAVESFTKREHAVAQLIARGHNNKEVARALGIGVPTVKGYLTTLFGKTDTKSRVELALRLWEQLIRHEPTATSSLVPGELNTARPPSFKSLLEARTKL